MKKYFFCLCLLLMLPLLLLGCKKEPDPNPASDFTYTVAEEGVTLTGFTAGSDGALVIPAEIEGKPVVKIAENAFYLRSFTSVYIPDSVTEIGEGAFQYTAITVLDLPDSVRRIGEYAFASCYQLAEVSLGAQLAEVGDFAFNKDTLLREIVIPAAVTNITEAAFSECTGLEAVKFLGNAPALYENPREDANYRGVNYIVYYRSTATGFTPEYWCSYASALW